MAVNFYRLVYHSAAFQSLSNKRSGVHVRTLKENPMLRMTLLIFAVLCVAILIGCSKTETMSNSNSTAGSTDKPKTMSTPEKTMTSTGEKIGVPECDDFIAKYDACVSSKVPEAARAQYKNALAQWRESWRGLAHNPQTKSTLVSVCKQAAEQQAAALKSYGCGF
jgi:hypothetical protein